MVKTFHSVARWIGDRNSAREAPQMRGAAPMLALFDPRLESLRGLASLVVCLHHGMGVFVSSEHFFVLDALLFAFNPAAAVIFFFVLSGYVLGRALERDGAFAPYLARRLFRLIPPFVAAVLFAFACERLLRIDPMPSAFTPGFGRMFWPEPSWDAVWDNLLLNSPRVNGPTWTLLPELLGSLMLPFLVAAHGSISPRWRWALFTGIATLLAISPYYTLLWFYFGSFVAKEVAAFLADRPRPAAITFVAGLIGLEMAGRNADFYAIRIVIPSAIAAAMMVGAVVSSRGLLQWTTVSPLRFLGRISFSLYLVHWPIFYMCALLAFMCDPIIPTQSWGNLFVTVTSLALALGVAALAYRFIEAPSIRAGKSVARILARTKLATASSPALAP